MKMTSENYNLYELREYISHNDKFLVDPITAVRAKRVLNDWYRGRSTAQYCVNKLVEWGVLEEEKVIR